MKRKKDSYYRLIELVIVVMISTMIGMFSGGAAIFTMSEIKKEECKECIENNNKDLNELSNIYEEILNNYYKDVDKKDLIDGAMKGMLSVLNDPNSSYLDPESKNSFDDRMIGEYHGVGLEIISNPDGNILIVNLFEDSPAKEVGIKIGDIIKSVDGVAAKDKPAEEVSALIKSGEKEIIAIEIDREGKILTFNVKKKTIVIKSVIKKTFTKDNQKIGYLKITVFASNTFSQLETALKELEKDNIKGLILDVRNNTGGYLSSVSSMLELFLPKNKTLYQLETKEETTKKIDLTDEKREYPIVVLVNEYSASASEILAAGLNESYGSKLVGAKTYGKGTVQQTFNVANGGMAKITTQKWLTPNGNWINETGITPTESLALNESFLYDQSDANDNQLQKALQVVVTK